MSDQEDIKDERIKKLEEEIARLKGQIVVTEEIFRGHPVLRFTGSFRPFSLGLSKSKAILKSIDQIRRFVEKYDKSEL